jgi:hypothetical protein
MWQPTPIDKTICLHPTAENELREWIQKKSHPAALLYGEPGIGKTTIAHRILRNFAKKVVEFNASHTRSGTSFRSVILPLLTEGGVFQMIETGKRGGIGVILDEIDGLSQGEKGGLKELLDYLRAWKTDQEHWTPLILISNTMDSRNILQISKLCKTLEIREADTKKVEEWLGLSLPSETYLKEVSGDLRFVQRNLAGLENRVESIECPEGIQPIAWWSLWKEWDVFTELDLESHEANLAGLVMIENLNDRIRKSLGDNHAAWKEYCHMFEAYVKSDRADFWAFFHQCWNLLPLSLDLKLKIPGLRLTTHSPLSEDVLRPDPMSLRYTPVLTKQSAMFNSWKFICELADRDGIPIRLVPSMCHLEAGKEGQKVEKQKRLRNIALQSMLEEKGKDT